MSARLMRDYPPFDTIVVPRGPLPPPSAAAAKFLLPDPPPPGCIEPDDHLRTWSNRFRAQQRFQPGGAR